VFAILQMYIIFFYLVCGATRIECTGRRVFTDLQAAALQAYTAADRRRLTPLFDFDYNERIWVIVNAKLLLNSGIEDGDIHVTVMITA